LAGSLWLSLAASFCDVTAASRTGGDSGLTASGLTAGGFTAGATWAVGARAGEWEMMTSSSSVKARATLSAFAATLASADLGAAEVNGSAGASGAGSTVSGLAVLRDGISMGISTGNGRGCVSNNKGNSTTAASTSTDTPIRRCLARCRTSSTLGGVAVAAAERGLNMRAGRKVDACDPNAKRGNETCQDERCLAASRGVPFSKTPPTV
jgi:hypothetical protein